MLKKILLGLLALLAVVVLGGAAFAFTQISAFDSSMAKVYDVPLEEIEVSTSTIVLERGKHLAEAIGGCHACHGPKLEGGRLEEMGPVGTMKGPNITRGQDAVGALYTDAEMYRLLKHGVRRDGTSVRFMPCMDWNWWPKEDVVALISYVRTFEPVDGHNGHMEVGMLGKILDRMDSMPLDVARRIDHDHLPTAPEPAPNAAYGEYIAKLCMGCHGPTLAGGPLPGAPPSIPVPLNLTPHETGLKDWSFADFDKLMREGVRKNGAKLDPFMPTETTRNFSETEMRAVWAYLQTLQPKPLGER